MINPNDPMFKDYMNDLGFSNKPFYEYDAMRKAFEEFAKNSSKRRVQFENMFKHPKKSDFADFDIECTNPLIDGIPDFSDFVITRNPKDSNNDENEILKFIQMRKRSDNPDDACRAKMAINIIPGWIPDNEDKPLFNYFTYVLSSAR